MGGLTARSFAGIDDPFSGRRRPSALQGASRFGHQSGARRRLKNTTRARAPARPRPRWALGRWGLRAWGPWGPLGTWALGRARATSRSHARLTKTGAAADNGSLHAAMPRCAAAGTAGASPTSLAAAGDSPCWLALSPAGGLPSGPGPPRSGLPPACERLGAAGASPTSLAAAGELPGFPHSYKKTSCFPHEINPVKSAIFL